MKILEVVQLRSACYPLERLGTQITASIENSPGSTERVVVYRRQGLLTDLAVHIYRETPDAGGPSQLGLQLAAALREYGLVEHTAWEEVG